MWVFAVTRRGRVAPSLSSDGRDSQATLVFSCSVFVSDGHATRPHARITRWFRRRVGISAHFGRCTAIRKHHCTWRSWVLLKFFFHFPIFFVVGRNPSLDGLVVVGGVRPNTM